jgi:hypothetical protein
MTLLKSALLAAALLLPTAVTAAPITLYSASGAAQFDGQFADFFDGDGDDIDVSVSVELSGGMFVGSLLVTDLSGVLLESSTVFDALVDLQPGVDSATLFFTDISGSAIVGLGNLVTAIFSFTLEDEDNGVFDPVDVTLYGEPAPIPVPASLGLLLLGLGALGSQVRRRA